MTDITTITGILAGFALVFIAIFIGGGIGTFFNLPSIMITFGGTFAAVLINYPLADIIRTTKVLRKAFRKMENLPHEYIKKIVKFAQKARKEGMLALEQNVKKEKDEFLRKGLQLLIDGTDIEIVEKMLNLELEAMIMRHLRGQNIFKTMGKFAPAFGMLGTLIGLIQMLRMIEDPSQIGPGMAVALVTTFYGVLAANLIFLPIAGKLETLSEDEILIRKIIIEGVRAIHAGEPPAILEEKLNGFLAPHLRRKWRKEPWAKEK